MIDGNIPTLSLYTLIENIGNAYNGWKLICQFWVIHQMTRFYSDKLAWMPFHGDHLSGYLVVLYETFTLKDNNCIKKHQKVIEK